MKKYVYIFKSELISSLSYVFNIAFQLVGHFIHIFIFFNLWNYIYSDSTQLINGYSKNQMIWYVIVTETIWTITAGRKLCRRICNDVRGGNIAYMINKPYSYVSYIVFSHLGEQTVKTVISFFIGVICGLALLKEFVDISLIGIITVIIACFLAVLISTLFATSIGLISFIIEDANPLFWLYSKALLVLGALFPVEFFPKTLQSVIRISPIYVICYGPARLFVDFSYKSALIILSVQVLYVFIAWGICNLLYYKGVKKLNVNGG